MVDERNIIFAALFARLSHSTLVSEDFGIFLIVFEFVQKRIQESRTFTVTVISIAAALFKCAENVYIKC